VASHFLEHLRTREAVYAALEQMVRVSTDFVFIQGPYFDADVILKDLGLKLYWSDWHGHPYHLSVRELLKWAAADSRIVRSHIGLSGLVSSSVDRVVHPISSPRDQHAYDPTIHPPKSDIALARPVYSEFSAYFALRDLDNWERLIQSRPSLFSCSTVDDFDAHVGY
jgi:hypothetical protein